MTASKLTIGSTTYDLKDAQAREDISEETARAIEAESGKANLINGKIQSSELPSYIDTISEYANRGSFPSSGQDGTIYVALDTGYSYRWSGTAYVQIVSGGTAGDVVFEYSATYGNATVGKELQSLYNPEVLYEVTLTEDVGSVSIPIDFDKYPKITVYIKRDNNTGLNCGAIKNENSTQSNSLMNNFTKYRPVLDVDIIPLTAVAGTHTALGRLRAADQGITPIWTGYFLRYAHGDWGINTGLYFTGDIISGTKFTVIRRY